MNDNPTRKGSADRTTALLNSRTSTNNNKNPDDPKVMKFALLGNSAVGKTCLLKQYTTGKFAEERATLINEISSKYIEIQGVKVKLFITDTSGEERFLSISSQYIRNLDGIFIVFDLTDDILTIQKQKEFWTNFIETSSKTKTRIMYVGNKTDKVLNQEELDDKIAKMNQMAMSDDRIFLAASAKSGENVQGVFEELAKQIYNLNKWNEVPSQMKNQHRLDDLMNDLQHHNGQKKKHELKKVNNKNESNSNSSSSSSSSGCC